ncbi:Rap1a/Tai family immunity protein [Pseudomonas sp. NY15356]|uniref:Rap1a/Tai family immunity protein n=1 Tax=unclassified Pseudomonas TaxID=196821 RepID=UPI003A83AD21
MKSKVIAIVLAGVVAGSCTVSAAGHDGNELLRNCKEFIKDGSFDALLAGECTGLIRGVASTVYFYSGDLKNDEKFCMPDDVTNGQVARIVIKYLEDNPKILNRPDMALVWEALIDAYPCT